MPLPPENYGQFAHKGGDTLQQPPNLDEMLRIERYERASVKATEVAKPVTTDAPRGAFNVAKLKPLKLIRKLWEK